MEVEPKLRPASEVVSIDLVVSLDLIDEDSTLQLRPTGDLSALATDLARLGQLFPIDLRPTAEHRFQVVCGFRRVAALRFLQRKEALARIHADLSDQDALLMALAAAIHSEGFSREQLLQARDRLDQTGRLTAPGRDMIDKALSADGSLAPETLGDLAARRNQSRSFPPGGGLHLARSTAARCAFDAAAVFGGAGGLSGRKR